AIPNLRGVRDLRSLPLLPPDRQQDDEVEDPENEHERDELDPQIAVGRRRHREQGAGGPETLQHHSDSTGWREKLWWNACLKRSNPPNIIASPMRRVGARKKCRLCSVLRVAPSISTARNL